MTEISIGYARCSTDKQDLTVQREALLKLGVGADRIYTDHGLTGTNRARPGLDQALADARPPAEALKKAANGLCDTPAAGYALRWRAAEPVLILIAGAFSS